RKVAEDQLSRRESQSVCQNRNASGEGRAVIIEAAQAKASRVVARITCAGDLETIFREEIRPGIVFTGCRNGDFAVQAGHTALEINLTNMRVALSGVAVKSIE